MARVLKQSAPKAFSASLLIALAVGVAAFSSARCTRGAPDESAGRIHRCLASPRGTYLALTVRRRVADRPVFDLYILATPELHPVRDVPGNGWVRVCWDWQADDKGLLISQWRIGEGQEQLAVLGLGGAGDRSYGWLPNWGIRGALALERGLLVLGSRTDVRLRRLFWIDTAPGATPQEVGDDLWLPSSNADPSQRQMTTYALALQDSQYSEIVGLVMPSGARSTVCGLPSGAGDLFVAPDGAKAAYFVYGDESSALQILQLRPTVQSLRILSDLHTGPRASISWAPDSERLSWVTGEGAVATMRLDSAGYQVNRLDCEGAPVKSLCWPHGFDTPLLLDDTSVWAEQEPGKARRLWSVPKGEQVE